jgi:transposase
MEKNTKKPGFIFHLSKKEKNELHTIIHTTSDASIYQHSIAIIALNSGESPNIVAKELQVCRQSLYKWFSRFKSCSQDSIENRLSNKKSTGRPKTVSGIIDEWILEVIDHDPRKYNYSSTTWTAGLLAKYIHEKHNFSASYNSIRRALDRLGFKWKRPRYTLSNRPSNWKRKKGGLNKAFSAIPAE